MPNDHYIPRMLTKPWEFGERQLRFFDFVTRSFEQAPSKRLFAKKDLNSPELEAWLNSTIETPVANYANDLRNGSPLRAPEDWCTLRALALFMFLNTQRLEEGRWNEKASVSLEDFASRTDNFGDRTAHWFLDKFKLFCVRTPPERELFFTEVVGFPYPLPESPVMVMPLGLRYAVLAYDGPLARAELLENVDLETLAVLSIGVGSNVHRVVLPPTWREASDENEDDVRERLLELRSGARQIFDLVGRASALVGLRAWSAT